MPLLVDALHQIAATDVEGWLVAVKAFAAISVIAAVAWWAVYAATGTTHFPDQED